MTLGMRTAMLRARAAPEIKYAGEEVLRKLGLTMSEAMDLFMRRLIVDQKLPFEITPLDDATIESIVSSWRLHSKEKSIDIGPRKQNRSRRRQKRE